jgi:hypothetical protein
MSRRKLIEKVQDRPNEFARIPAVGTAINRCFGEELLPLWKDSDLGKFDHQEIFGDMYVSEREGDESLRAVTNTASFPHEAYLDQLFWNDNPSYTKIFLLGDVGCGKSTLVNYYLRCYCPANGRKREEFNAKLVISLNAIEYPDIADSTENFYHYAQGVLRRNCESRGIDLEDLVKQHFLRHMNVRQWVLHAMEQLSDAANTKLNSFPIKYLVLVLDNLDQCTPDIQKKTLAIAEGWLRSRTINIWRVIVPLWPSTLKRLQYQDFGPARRGIEFSVGALPVQQIIQRRTEALANEINKAQPISLQSEEAFTYVAGIYGLVRRKLLQRINGLCNDNLRHKLRLWKGLINGEPALNLWRQLKGSSDQSRLYEYELLDAILCGTQDCFCPESTGIANVFTMGERGEEPRNLLIGLHALVLLDRAIVAYRSTLNTELMRLGYRSSDIQALERSLRYFNIYHEIPPRHGVDKDAELEVHPSVLQAYLELCLEPAYLDNAAMVTPVDPVILGYMVRTRGDRAESFPTRVTSTIRFIDFLRTNEEAFSDTQTIDSHVQTNFNLYLARAQLPYFWKEMAGKYYDRLSSLRERGYTLNVSDSWWDEVLRRPIFEEAKVPPFVIMPRES